MTIALDLVDVYNKAGGVSEKTLKFLYKLLSQRKPYQNISHKRMPTWEEHSAFVRGKPYYRWYLLKFGKTIVGATYISRANEIGIFLLDVCQHQGIGQIALTSLYLNHPECDYFYANIAPFNTSSLAFFLNRGYLYKEYIAKKGKIVQFTFYAPNPYYDGGKTYQASQSQSSEPVK